MKEYYFIYLVSTVFDISFTSGIIIFHIFLNILIMGNSSKHQREKKNRAVHFYEKSKEQSNFDHV